MPAEIPVTTLQLQSLVKADQTVELSLDTVQVPEPGPGEVIVRVEASPINPSDIGLLLAGADVTAAVASGSADRPVVTAPLPDAAMSAAAGRVGIPMATGNEGAGTVVAAGPFPAATARSVRRSPWLGAECTRSTLRGRVAVPGAARRHHRRPMGRPRFVNPMTVLGMVETMRLENHTALVHTAAASNLGEMSTGCASRSRSRRRTSCAGRSKRRLLRSAGATYACNSASPVFTDELIAALTETSATLAFDATGGGRLASQISPPWRGQPAAAPSCSRVRVAPSTNRSTSTERSTGGRQSWRATSAWPGVGGGCSRRSCEDRPGGPGAIRSESLPS